MNKYSIDIVFEIRSPIMVKASSTWEYGVDVMFHRDWQDRLCIPASHIKGKLREAMKELSMTSPDVYKMDVNDYLGKESGDKKGNYEPFKGILEITDFVAKDKPNEGENLCRISIDELTGTAKEGHLLVIELPFNHGRTVQFKGTISFFEHDQNEAQEKYEEIKRSLKWITTLGAFNSVGFGNVKCVKAVFKDPINMSYFSSSVKINNRKSIQVLDLEITAEEPLLIGGQCTKSNYLESISYIPGSVIKGALAANISMILNPAKRNVPISKADGLIAEQFRLLKNIYDNIRFTHAFPTLDTQRPYQIPLSIIKFTDEGKNKYNDILVCDEKTPSYFEFQIDWKDDSYIKRICHWAEPKRIFHTRTAIDEDLHSAKREQLFTYQYLCPIDEKKNKIRWRSRIFLPDSISGEDRKELIDQLIFVLENYLTCIGKRDSEVKAVCKIIDNDKEKPRDEYQIGEKLIVTLQSDTLIVNPDEMILEYSGDKLKDLYKNYWGRISNESLEMEDYYAKQDIHGGYMVKRYQKGSDYYPFYVTCAGSAFLLKVRDSSKAKTFINDAYIKGLKPPEWVEKKYCPFKEPLWQKCPFIPENGYGEVKITKVDDYNKLLERM